MSSYMIANALLVEYKGDRQAAYAAFVARLMADNQFLANKAREFIANVVFCIFTIEGPS